MAAARSFRQTGLPVSRASPAPTMAVQAFYPGYTTQNCGSGLARDGSASVIQTDRVACIAGKPGSHNGRVSFLPWVHPLKLWERACSRWQRFGPSDRPGCLHRGQARLPQWPCKFFTLGTPPNTVGAGLPAMAAPLPQFLTSLAQQYPRHPALFHLDHGQVPVFPRQFVANHWQTVQQTHHHPGHRLIVVCRLG